MEWSGEGRLGSGPRLREDRVGVSESEVKREAEVEWDGGRIRGLSEYIYDSGHVARSLGLSELRNRRCLISGDSLGMIHLERRPDLRATDRSGSSS
jgi:hypothetical protein